MGQFKKISAKELENVLSKSKRQYLVGDLKLPQLLEHIPSEKIEIGISEYDKNEIEEAHYHTNQTEYQIVLWGKTEYLDIDTKEICTYQTGDFYSIEPFTKYAQRVYGKTRILFIKIPALNDKVKIRHDLFIQNWLDSHLSSDQGLRRKDYYNDDKAPKPNSLKPAVAGALIKNNEILLLKREDSHNWTMPGGTLELGECLTDALVREIKEETGLEIKILDIIGTYSNPQTVISYANGEVRQEFTILYLVEFINGTLKIDNESIDIKWIKREDLTNLNFAPSQLIRIFDAYEFVTNRVTFMK